MPGYPGLSRRLRRGSRKRRNIAVPSTDNVRAGAYSDAPREPERRIAPSAIGKELPQMLRPAPQVEVPRPPLQSIRPSIAKLPGSGVANRRSMAQIGAMLWRLRTQGRK